MLHFDDWVQGLLGLDLVYVGSVVIHQLVYHLYFRPSQVREMLVGAFDAVVVRRQQDYSLVVNQDSG
jgi:hypothetical protein